jgi:hypothetical protein
MKKTLIIAALAASTLVSVPARAGLNSADWGAILGAVVEVAGAAATGYAAAQQAQADAQAAAQQQVTPTIFYTGFYMKAWGVKVCQYTDGSELAIDSRSSCPAYF